MIAVSVVTNENYDDDKQMNTIARLFTCDIKI